MAKKKVSKSPLVAQRDADKTPKSNCPITAKEFMIAADDVPVMLGKGHQLVATKRLMKTGSFGWLISTKASIMVGELPLLVQVTVNLVVVGSKGRAV